jgi:flagellar motor switch protein FliG
MKPTPITATTDHDELAARLVVALDAPASAAVLRAMPVAQVQRVTEALGTLDAVGHDDLAEAVDAFLAEVGEQGAGGYRGGPEAP